MVKTEHKIQPDPSKTMPSPPSSSSSCKKKYKGVRMRSWGSWVSEIRAPNQKTRIWLGSYSTAEAAARAYDAALLCLKGTSANLNFPITSSHYIPDTIMSPKSIQRVAAAAAAAAAANNFLDHKPTTPPSPNPPSSSSSISSPSSSFSPSDHLDDDVSVMPSFGNYTLCDQVNEPPMAPMTTPWYEYAFDVDQMFSGALFDPPMIEDFCEEGDIRLWSFC